MTIKVAKVYSRINQILVTWQAEEDDHRVQSRIISLFKMYIVHKFEEKL